MSTSEHVFWLAVPHDQRDVARAASGKLGDGRAGIAWNNELKLWYARPGCDLERVREWWPDRSQRATGGDPEAEFLDALTAAGLVLNGLPVMDGQRQRVATVEDKKGKKSGLYRGYLDRRPGGFFINYHRAANEKDITNWKATGGEADAASRLHIRAAAQQSKDDAERKRAAEYAKQRAAAERLYGIFSRADPGHGYLERKGISATPELRQTNNGALVVPFFDVHGEFQTLQYIPATGDKFLFEGAPKQGHFLVVGGELKNGDPILYAEGYATARSINLAVGIPVVMTIDAGNMVAVAEVLKKHYPESPHLFLSDFDHAKPENKGLLMATSAAEKVGGQVLYPQFTEAELAPGITDFNDLHKLRGLEAVAAQIVPSLQSLRKEPASMDKPQPAAPIVSTPVPVEELDSKVLDVSVGEGDAVTQLASPNAPMQQSEVVSEPRSSEMPAHSGAEMAPAAPRKTRTPAKPAQPARSGEEKAPAAAKKTRAPAKAAQSGEEKAPAAPRKIRTSAKPVQPDATLQPEIAPAVTKEAEGALVAEGVTSGEVKADSQAPTTAEPVTPAAEAVVATDEVEGGNPQQDIGPSAADLLAGADAEAERRKPAVENLPTGEARADSQTPTAAEPATPATEAVLVADEVGSSNPQQGIGPSVSGQHADIVPEAEVVEPVKPSPPPAPAENENVQESVDSGLSVAPIGKPSAGPDKPIGEEADTSAAVDSIWVGPPRPSGEEPPELQQIDKDALLARLTWEKQDNNTVLYKLDGEPAFIDRGMRLDMAEGASQSDEKVLAALLTAAQYYRGRIELTGSEEFQRRAIGLIAAHQLNVSMKNPTQQAQLEDARKALQAVPAQNDSISGDAPPLTGADPLAVQMQAAQPTVTSTSPQLVASAPTPAPAPVSAATAQSPSTPVTQSADAAASQAEKAIHTPHQEAKDGVKGKVMGFGDAPFRFDPNNTASTYLTLRTRQGTQTFWGKELAGLLRDTRIQKGNVVTLKWLGKEAVVVKVPVKDGEGTVVRYEGKNAHRNQWSLEPLGRPAVTTGDDVGVKLNAYDVDRFAALQQELVARMRLEVPLPDRPKDGLFWMTPDGEGSAKAGDHLSAPRPAMDLKAAGQPVMSSWTRDGQLDMALVRGDGPYLQGVVRHEGQLQHVLVSLPDRENAPPMVFNLVTAAGLAPIGVGHGINKAGGVAVSRESIAFKLDGDTAARVGRLERPAEVPPALHARLGFDERWRDDNTLPKSAPAAAPTAQPSEPRPA